MAISTAILGSYYMTNVYVNASLSFLMLKFLFEYKPMDRYSLNWIAIFNEISLLFSNFFMFLFSDFIGNVEFRYNFVGMAYIDYLLISFRINFILIFIGTGLDAIFKLKKKNHDKKWGEYDKNKNKMANFLVYQVI